MYSKNDIEYIRNHVSIEEVIGKRISMKKKTSSSYIVKCPFHNDSNPSMHVNTAKQIYKCFSCGAGGDVFKFVSEYDAMSFVETLDYLVLEYSIPINKKNQYKNTNSKNYDNKSYHSEIKQVNEYISKVYHQYLMLHKDAKNARGYVFSRNISPDMLKKYMIGYAPNRMQFLMNLLKNKYSFESLKLSGLFYSNSMNQFSDFMRDRIVFPIANERNEILGFGGRVFSGESNVAKYLNTKETPVFFKHSVLYGLNYSMALIRNKKEAYVVEGYLDVIACLESDLGAVAPLGTSLTENHLMKLKRLASEIIFLFDGDEAGKKACLRACRMSLSMGINSSIVVFDSGLDPFEYMNKYSSEKLKEYTASNRIGSVDYLFNHYAKDWSKLNEYQKSSILKELNELIQSIGDSFLKQRVIDTFSNRLNINSDELLRTKNVSRVLTREIKIPTLIKIQRELIIYLITYPYFIKNAITLFSLKDFKKDISSQLFEILLKIYQSGEEFHFHVFLNNLDEKVKHYVEKSVMELEIRLGDDGKKDKLFQDIACRLKEVQIKKKIKEIKIKIAEVDNDEESIQYRGELMRLVSERNNLSSYFIKN